MKAILMIMWILFL